MMELSIAATIDLRIAVTYAMKGSPLPGELYLALNGDRFFPQQHWPDFTAVVLSWWVRNVIGLRDGFKSEFLFMDGPPRFSALRLDEALHLSFNQRNRNFENPDDIEVSWTVFLAAIADACVSVLETCTIPELAQSPDVIELNAGYQTLRQQFPE